MDKALQKGLAGLTARQYERVHRDAIERIHSDVNDPIPYYLLGRIALEHQNFAKSGELFEKACSLGPGNPLYVAGHAEHLVTIGRQLDALRLADEAANLDINDAFTADTIGVIYSRTGFHEKAVPLFERAVELDPAPAKLWLRLTRQGDAVEVHYSLDGEAYVMIRVAYLPAADEAEVGLMCASPEGDGFTVTFEDLAIDNR